MITAATEPSGHALSDPFHVILFEIRGAGGAQLAEALPDITEDTLPDQTGHPRPLSWSVTEQADNLWQAEFMFAGPVPDLDAFRTWIMPYVACASLKPEHFRLQSLPGTDWLARNRADFPPVHAGRTTILREHHICAETTPLEPGRIVLVLEAATAFGSGTHESTRGCLEAMDILARNQNFRNILDLGCGSGILALSAAGTWPEARVTASDHDPEAVRVTRMNAARNNLGAIHTLCADNMDHTGLSGPFDLVLANLLFEPLHALAPALARVLAPGGFLVLSGLLDHQQERLENRMTECGLVFSEALERTPWVTLVMSQPPGTRDCKKDCKLPG